MCNSKTRKIISANRERKKFLEQYIYLFIARKKERQIEMQLEEKFRQWSLILCTFHGYKKDTRCCGYTKYIMRIITKPLRNGPTSGNIWRFEAENGQIFSHFSHLRPKRCAFYLAFSYREHCGFLSLFSRGKDKYISIPRDTRIIKRTKRKKPVDLRETSFQQLLGFRSHFSCPTYYANSLPSGYW